MNTELMQMGRPLTSNVTPAIRLYVKLLVTLLLVVLVPLLA
jgi:hypothetical protein